MSSTLHEAVGADLSRVELFVDFDGTLSPIVDRPDDAAPAEGVVDALTSLAAELARLTVVSGRPVEFLAEALPVTGVAFVGLYGIESFDGAAVVVHPEAVPWEDAIAEAAEAAYAEAVAIAGLAVEHKRFSITLHFRNRPEIAAEVCNWAEQQAEHSGLIVRPARQAVELHPKIETDKGAAIVARVLATTRTVVYIGDDNGDLPAFDALDRLEADGLDVLRVAVASDEMPPELGRRADLVLDNPAAVASFLTI